MTSIHSVFPPPEPAGPPDEEWGEEDARIEAMTDAELVAEVHRRWSCPRA